MSQPNYGYPQHGQQQPYYNQQPGYYPQNQQPGYYPQAQPQTIYVERPRRGGNNTGLCAALLAGLCCGCCLDDCCDNGGCCGCCDC